MNRTALVTGARSGIGLAVARGLIARGWTVWGTSRRIEGWNPPDGLRPLALDLGDPASIDAAASACMPDGRPPGLLVNNAGSGWLGSLEAADDAVMRDQFQILVFGPMRLVRVFLPGWREAGGGLLVNVSSMAADLPVPYLGPYSAAKAALGVLSEQLTLECGDDPVRILDYRPGDIKTDFNRALGEADPSRSPGDPGRFLRAWKQIQIHLDQAPGPETAARDILAWVGHPVSDRRIGGGWDQRLLASGLVHLLPRRVIRWGIRCYYRL